MNVIRYPGLSLLGVNIVPKENPPLDHCDLGEEGVGTAPRSNPEWMLIFAPIRDPWLQTLPSLNFKTIAMSFAGLMSPQPQPASLAALQREEAQGNGDAENSIKLL